MSGSPPIAAASSEDHAESSAALSMDIPIVLLASACWETPAPVNVHHLARRFAERGHRVLFVESTGLRSPALGSAHDVSRITRRLKRWRQGVREVERNLFVLSPLAMPWRWPMPARRMSMRWIARAARRAAKRLDMRDPVLWAFLPTALRAIQRNPGCLRVYQCVDHYAANPGVDGPWIESIERALLDRADLVLATSDVLADRLREHRQDVVSLPNVADVDLFGRAVHEELPEPPELAALPKPRVIYVGNLAAYRIDFEWLDALATARTGVQLVFVGVVGLGDADELPEACRRLVARPNVHLIEPKPQAELPAFLRHCDAALIPFLDNEHTRGSFPLKFWEYAAGGLPVVARDLPNFRDELLRDVLHLADDEASFIEAVDEALRASGSERRLARHELARSHNWPARIEEIAGLFASQVERRAARDA